MHADQDAVSIIIIAEIRYVLILYVCAWTVCFILFFSHSFVFHLFEHNIYSLIQRIYNNDICWNNLIV